MYSVKYNIFNGLDICSRIETLYIRDLYFYPMEDNSTRIIGLMSGTSLDGVDLVCVDFYNNNGVYTYDIVEANTYDYPSHWESKLRNAFRGELGDLRNLDVEYGAYLGGVINTFIKEYNIIGIDMVASHGHTIFHKPEEGVTLQIGSGEHIAKEVGLKVICDFRTQDVKLGGQGAPLVPVGDQLLFSQYDYCLNLGGFANVSFQSDEIRLAFDICPVNIVLNHFSKLLGFEYDDKGVLASEGVVHEQLLTELNDLSFYKDVGPKSLGYEFVVNEVFPVILRYDLHEKDILRTFIAHIVDQISRKVKKDGSLLVTGGGVYNEFLISQMKRKLKNPLVVPDNRLVEFKEALIFAFLGLLKSENKVNCLMSVTGAKRDHSSGEIYEFS